jgi:micrococcal nuclease
VPRRLIASLVAAVALAAVVVYLVAGSLFGSSGPHGPFSARVVRAVDGDTLLVRLASGSSERVRVIGVDTPEDVAPGRPVQCGSRRAAAYTQHVLAGRRVRLVPGREQHDRYGRLLAYVRRADGLDLEVELLRRGLARTLAIAPNVDRAARYARLEIAARRAGRGLWGACPSAAAWAAS